MANVILHPPGTPAEPTLPSAEPARPAPKPSSQVMYCTDETGRQIGWRKLNALEDFDLTEIAGPTNVANDEWMLRASVAFGVREIDGEPVSRPANKNQLR